jgi:hypothetical protein
MHVPPVDPRDTRWEVDRPSYRVYFWTRHETPDGSLAPASDEWEVSDADVDEVLAWASSAARERSFVVYACASDSEGLGLVRLLGSAP